MNRARMYRPRRFAGLFLILAFVGALLMGGASASTAAEEGETSVGGTLRMAGEPVEGVELSVSEAGGGEIAAATSAEDGTWRVPLPAGGDYTIELDTETLPDGVGLGPKARNPLNLSIRDGANQTVVFVLVDGESGGGSVTGTSRIERVPQALFNGLETGLIIAMAAIGLSLVYGTTRQINFAHGEFVTLGAVIAWYLNAGAPGLPLIIAILIGAVVVGAFSGGLEKVMWRPLRRRKAGRFQLLIVAIGLSLALRHLILIFFGGGGRTYDDYQVQKPWEIGPLSITPRDASVVVISATILIAISLVLKRSKLGKATRAVASDRNLASISGIDVRGVILGIWIVGGALAALGGGLLGLVQGVTWHMGFDLLLLMFAGVVLGGLGTAYGTMVGSIVIGLIMELSTLWFPAELKVAWALAVLVLILIFRPQGIFGARERIG